MLSFAQPQVTIDSPPPNRQVLAKKGTTELNLRGKLVDQVEWFPVSPGKLQDITELDLSKKRIMALPSTIGSLRYLTKLDLHSNQLINLPDTFGELSSLIDLDLRANQLKSLPTSFRNLTSLSLSSFCLHKI